MVTIGNAFKGALLVITVLLLSGLTGCSSASSKQTPSGEGTIAVSVPGGALRYVNLSEAIVSDDSGGVSGTSAWDLAFDSDRFIFTNSGASAIQFSSGGTGGVWFTGTTDISSVDSASGASFAGDYNTDAARWIDYPEMMGGLQEKRLNVMTYVGYDNDETAAGTELDPFSATFEYDKEEYYYNAGDMPPVFLVRDRVYIIRHGDGTKHTAVVISGLEGDGDPRIYQITYKHLD
jgi:hypothetical protein